jgi:hypothetical protein
VLRRQGGRIPATCAPDGAILGCAPDLNAAIRSWVALGAASLLDNWLKTAPLAPTHPASPPMKGPRGASGPMTP